MLLKGSAERLARAAVLPCGERQGIVEVHVPLQNRHGMRGVQNRRGVLILHSCKAEKKVSLLLQSCSVGPQTLQRLSTVHTTLVHDG